MWRKIGLLHAKAALLLLVSVASASFCMDFVGFLVDSARFSVVLGGHHVFMYVPILVISK